VTGGQQAPGAATSRARGRRRRHHHKDSCRVARKDDRGSGRRVGGPRRLVFRAFLAAPPAEQLRALAVDPSRLSRSVGAQGLTVDLAYALVAEAPLPLWELS